MHLDFFEHSDGSEEDMGQKTTDAMIKSQFDCMIARVCQKAYVEAQHSVQCVKPRRKNLNWGNGTKVGKNVLS